MINQVKIQDEEKLTGEDFELGDISDHDHAVFDILIRDRVSRLRELNDCSSVCFLK
jgi:hypothetical protein